MPRAGGYECVLTERSAGGGRQDFAVGGGVGSLGVCLSFRVCACRFMYPRVPSRRCVPGVRERSGGV